MSELLLLARLVNALLRLRRHSDPRSVRRVQRLLLRYLAVSAAAAAPRRRPGRPAALDDLRARRRRGEL